MELVEAIAGTVHRQVRPHVEYQELLSLGTAGLLEAVDRYDPDRGITLATFAYYRIRGSIYDGLRAMGTLPRGVYRQATIGRHTDEYLENCGRRAASARQPGRQPGRSSAAGDTLSTTRALARNLRNVIAIQIVARASSAPAFSSTLTSTAAGWVEDMQVTLADPRVVPSDEQVLQKQRLERLRAALTSLPEREERVIRRCYFEGQSLGAVAQELGLSISWTSRLHARAVERLRDLLGEDNDEPRSSR